mmetsp:Transcript_27710/g.65073  ORF Transcript_27710/g.65073 Transcript_27710/m.65073 type:complete len:237 (+) Transcript_27710:177-887(+)
MRFCAFCLCRLVLRSLHRLSVSPHGWIVRVAIHSPCAQGFFHVPGRSKTSVSGCSFFVPFVFFVAARAFVSSPGCCCCCSSRCRCRARSSGRRRSRRKELGSRLPGQAHRGRGVSHSPIHGTRDRSGCHGGRLPVRGVPRDPPEIGGAAKGIRSGKGQWCVARVGRRVHTRAGSSSDVAVLFLEVHVGRARMKAVRLVFRIDREAGTPRAGIPRRLFPTGLSGASGHADGGGGNGM